MTTDHGDLLVEAMAKAERIANATGRQVIIGVRPMGKGWYIHWGDWETDCANGPQGILDAVGSLSDEVTQNYQRTLHASKAAQNDAQRVLSALERQP